MQAYLPLMLAAVTLAAPAAAQQLPEPTPAAPAASAPAPNGASDAAPAGSAPAAAAQAAAATEPCYSIVQPAQGVAPDGSMMIDRCTGKTWLLIRIPIPNDKGEATGDFAYRWAPILYGDREALLSSPPPPRPAAPPPASTKKKTR